MMAQALPDAAYVDSQYSLLQLSTMAEQGDARAAYLLGTAMRRDVQAYATTARLCAGSSVQPNSKLPEAQFNRSHVCDWARRRARARQSG